MSELDRLHYQLLLAVHRHGTVGKAASALHMSQSAASQRLLQAQRRLGIELTTKHGRTVSLTPAALCLVQAARHSERLLRAAEAEALWLDHSAAPTLTMAVDVHDALWWLPPLLAELDASANAPASKRSAAPPTKDHGSSPRVAPTSTSPRTPAGSHGSTRPRRPPRRCGRRNQPVGPRRH